MGWEQYDVLGCTQGTPTGIWSSRCSAYVVSKAYCSLQGLLISGLSHNQGDSERDAFLQLCGRVRFKKLSLAEEPGVETPRHVHIDIEYACSVGGMNSDHLGDTPRTQRICVASTCGKHDT